MKVLRTEDTESRPDRYAMQVLHDEPNVRVIGFHLLPGQLVPPHSNRSTVVVQVIEGEGLFRGEDGEVRLSAGMTVVYTPGETHSIESTGGPLRFHAIIAPAAR